MDVEIGRGAEALDEGKRTSVSLAAFQSRLFDRSPVYAWFTDGFDTQDSKEAKARLDELR